MKMWSEDIGKSRDLYFEVEGVELNVFRGSEDTRFVMAWVKRGWSEGVEFIHDRPFGAADRPIAAQAIAAFRAAVAEGRAMRWAGLL